MSKAEPRREGKRTTYFVDDRPLANGDALELRLGGNKGWASVTITGLPDVLRLQVEANDGTRLVTTVPPEAELRWP
ncbi:MAG: hypothetical protein KC501_39755 [Myxococcales bacterium]|nr:hypothetical protein [Myxococcales bacterium]